MPKATLKFKLPDERREFDLACRAGALASAVYSFCNELRSLDKHSDTKPESWAQVRQMAANMLTLAEGDD